jgi:uncharacterized protein YdeI (BOF family)
MKAKLLFAGMLALQSTAVLAANTLSNLPPSGNVTLMGTVDRIADRDTFILKDENGYTIDVHTDNALQIRTGDRVQVLGMVQSEALGVGREVVHARISAIANDNRAMGGPYEPIDTAPRY